MSVEVLDGFDSHPLLSQALSREGGLPWRLGILEGVSGRGDNCDAAERLRIQAARTASKALFDFTAASLVEAGKGGEAPRGSLHVSGFDAEQIWAQIDGLSTELSKRTRRLLRKAGGEPSFLAEGVEEDLDELLDGRDGREAGEAVPANGTLEVVEESSRGEGTDDEDKEDAGSLEADETDEASQGGSDGAEAGDGALAKGRLAVEDDFMNLDDMERFVQNAEAEAMGLEDGAHLEDDEGDDAEGGPGDPDRMGGPSGDGIARGELGQEDDLDGPEIRHDDFFGRVKKRRRGGEGGEGGEGEVGGDLEWGDPGEAELAAAKARAAKGRASRFDLGGLSLAEQISRLEEEALAEKPWPLKGEVTGADRPLNSVLAADLEYDTTMRPAPQPTEASTQSLEELIKRRIANHEFDDVVRVVPPPVEEKKVLIEMDDAKAKQGLGELYEADYVRASGPMGAHDKDEGLRQEARQLLADLCLRLDALTHFHFTPKPVVEQMEVKVDVPALAMEDAVPMAVSEAQLRAPEEIYRSGAKAGEVMGDGEIERDDRRRMRRAKKRAFKNRERAKAAERASRAASKGGEAPVAGVKSAKGKEGKSVNGKGEISVKGKEAGGGGSKLRFGSGAVFAKLQAEREGRGEGARRRKGGEELKSAAVKL
eukprot:evm.model.scf_1173.1 EVM.evm.TU.scf_1173.1   scf_1173:928-4456(-)